MSETKKCYIRRNNLPWVQGKPHHQAALQIYMSSYMNIIDHTKHFYRIIQQGGDSEMILCRDENNTNNVNLDVIIFRRSEWTFYKLKQLYWADNISYDIIMDQIYTKYLPKYHINDILVNKGVPYILTNICVYNEHAFNSSRSSFIVNTKISSNKIDIYPWKSIDGYIEIGKNFNNLPNNNLPNNNLPNNNLPNNNLQSERKIPKYIFQTMETSLITDDIYKNGPLRWMYIHPSYTYFFFDSLDRRNFIRDNFPSYVFKMYNKLIPGAFKADLWRYCVLYKYGGCYIDIMLYPKKSLDTVISKDDIFISATTNNDAIDQVFLLTEKGCKIMIKMIKKCCLNIEFDEYSLTRFCLHITGPWALLRVVNDIHNKPLSTYIRKYF